MNTKTVSLLLGAVLISGCWDMGGGVATGIVTEVDQSGLFWIQPVITMIAGKGNATVPQSCSVKRNNPDKEKMLGVLSEALENGRPVVVKYRSEVFCAPWVSGGNINIVSVEYAK